MTKLTLGYTDQTTENNFYKLVEQFSHSSELEKIKWAYEEEKEAFEQAGDGSTPNNQDLERSLDLIKELKAGVLVAYEKSGTIHSYDIDMHNSWDEEIGYTEESDNNNAVKCEDYNLFNLIEELENTNKTGNTDDIRTAARSESVGVKGYIVSNINDDFNPENAGLELVEFNSKLERDINYNNFVLGDTDQNHYFTVKFDDLDVNDIDILFRKYF